MILAKLNNSKRYEGLNPLFPALFKFVAENDLAKKEKGRITLSGDDLYINIVEVDMKDPNDQVLEVHKDYIDVHFPINVSEIIGWKALEKCESEIQVYSKETDYALYSDVPTNYCTVEPGEFVIVFPEDAHTPTIGKGSLFKGIAKVRI